MKKIHLKTGCALGRVHDFSNAASDPEQVTCKQCLKIIERKGLLPRRLFPEEPTFVATQIDEVCVSFVCPVCGQENTHGAIEGHRVSHCGCWGAYYIMIEGNTHEVTR